MNKLFTFVLTLCMVHSLQAQRAVTSRLKIFAAPADLGRLQQAGVNFDHGFMDPEAGTYINEFDASDTVLIKKAGLRFKVLVPDVFAYNDSLNKLQTRKGSNPLTGIKPQAPQIQALRLNFTSACQSNINSIATPAGWTTGSCAGFFNLAELEAQVNSMIATYPNLVRRENFGTTVQGRQMWVVKISDNVIDDEDEPEMLYTGMHHSREGMSMMNLVYFMRYLLSNYTNNQSVREIVDSRELFFIPVVNLDGFNFNTTASNWSAGIRMRRKNLRETNGTSGIQSSSNGSGGDGVDLNRNYPQWWGAAYANTSTTQVGSTGGVTDDTYRGPSAGSEVETQNMMTFVNSRNFKLAINYHCFGNWWIRAGGPDEATHPVTAVAPQHVSVFNSVAALMTRYNCYVYGNPKQTVYPVNGFSDDWMLLGSTKSPIYSFSPEIGTSDDGFWPALARIEPLAKELVFSNLQAAYMAGAYAELTDLSNLNLTSTTGTFDFSVVRRGLVPGDVRVSLTPVSGLATTAGAVTIAATSLANYGSTATGSISYTLPANITPGTQVRFTWVMEVGGVTMRETVTRIYQPAVVFSDNMDVATDFATRWLNVGTGAAWNYQSGAGIGGTGALTESPSGNYADGALHTVRLRNALNLSGASAVFLSYLVRYKTENCQDRLQLQLSSNGLTGTYTNLCGNNTIRESRLAMVGTPGYTGSTDGWVREVVDLTSYAGNSNVGLQFVFQSNADNRAAYERDGFLIDNLVVTKSTGFMLPVQFEHIVATRVENSVKLFWRAQVVGEFAHYLVERSTDGVKFEALSRLTNPEANTYLDVRPMMGANYYRIRAIDKDGSEHVSKTVQVVFAPMQQSTGYPNPVVDNYTIQLEHTGQTTGFVTIQAADGRVVLHQQIEISKGLNTKTIALGKLPPQLYLIKIFDKSGRQLYAAKVMKTN